MPLAFISTYDRITLIPKKKLHFNTAHRFFLKSLSVRITLIVLLEVLPMYL